MSSLHDHDAEYKNNIDVVDIAATANENFMELMKWNLTPNTKAMERLVQQQQ